VAGLNAGLSAIETMGVWGLGASLLRDLGGQLAVQLGDPQAFQAEAVLRGNAFSVKGMFPEEFNTPKDALLLEDVLR